MYNTLAYDSSDISLIKKFLFDKYGAVGADHESQGFDPGQVWETGPFKIEEKEMSSSFERNYRFYAVCSPIRGIQGPSFKMVMMITPSSEIREFNYENLCSVLNPALKKNRSKNDLPTIAAALMKILTIQHCLETMLISSDIKQQKTADGYRFTLRKGTGYRNSKNPAYSWTITFDEQLNCTRAEFVCDLPPVP